MKKFFIYVGVFFCATAIIGLIGSMFDKGSSKPVTPEDYVRTAKGMLWETCDDTIQMKYLFYVLDSIKNKGGVAGKMADSVLMKKGDIAISVQMRFMEKFVKEAKESIKKQFDAYSGCHIKLTETIKSQLNDPESFKHVETKYDIGSGYKYINVYETFRFKNVYGGVETHMVAARYTSEGEFIEFLNL